MVVFSALPVPFPRLAVLPVAAAYELVVSLPVVQGKETTPCAIAVCKFIIPISMIISICSADTCLIRSPCQFVPRFCAITSIFGLVRFCEEPDAGLAPAIDENLSSPVFITCSSFNRYALADAS
nr:MAG: hypothetical protein [Bacteriophage sp.]